LIFSKEEEVHSDGESGAHRLNRPQAWGDKG
jgi:hypothetical protein